MPQITTRDAVIRAMNAMEIAESCSHPEIRSAFTGLAETWLQQAAEVEREPLDEAPDEAAPAA
ncbi:MAG TPA: hypothetical protein VFX95_03060 [Caulobacteraceae bacterium]|nr:hypothetical protein [Caulobacteraceae bacterium]